MLDSTYDRLVSRIYETPLQPENWNTVLQDVLGWLGAYNGHIHVYDRIDHKGCSSSSVGLDPAYSKVFNEQFSHVPPPCSLVSPGEEIVSHSLQAVSPRSMYEEFFRPQEMHHVLLGHLLKTPEKSWVLAATRPVSWSSFSAAQQRLCAPLLPHLRRALLLETELKRAQARASFAEHILDHVTHAVFVFDEQGRILQTNQIADRFLVSSTNLKLSAQGRLRAARILDTSLIQKSFALATRRIHPEGSTISIEQPDTRHPLLLRFLPVRNADVTWLREQPSVLVFISNFSQKTEDPFTAVAQLYGLTPAESRVGLELIRGKSLKEISELLSITLLTVRSHLRSIFQRTGTKSQREFVALVLRALTGEGALNQKDLQ